MNLYWVVGILLLYNTEAITGSGEGAVDAQEFRLPLSIVPTHYHLRLQPILDETPEFTRFTAPGTVKITVNCTEDTSSITLHALEITIIANSIVVTDVQSNESLSILNIRTEPEHHFLIINLAEPLKAGDQYEVFIRFVTLVSQTRLDGMYLDSYVDPRTNETKYVATTTFAAISARFCFPSFDEPQLKAVFTIELVRKEGYHSLSNRHQIATEPLEGMDGWFVDKFAPSLPMSTYLVAMIVSDMTYEEAVNPRLVDNESTTIRVYAPYFFIDLGGGAYSANQTKNVLSSFEGYFNNTFMLNKLDSVSLPRFMFSAMENWGLITYNDKVLLYFPGETTEQERYRITSITAHEVVHHYSGNLVTCEWWTWVWLNEGGATYFSYFGVDMTYPEFNPWDRFIADTYQVAMEADSDPTTHPVANEPTSTEDIGGIYNAIAYQKGASLLRMMQSFLTEEVMQTAFRKYFKEKEFSNARQDDLFNILQLTADEFGKTLPASIKEIMDTWTLLAGFPLLRVSRIDSTTISITQERFHLEPITSEEKWWIPISIAVVSPSPKEYFFWMSNTENQTTFSIPDTEVFVVNPRSEGFFRTLYSPDLLQNILQNSKRECFANQDSKFDSVAKSKLIDDYIAFSQAGLAQLEVGSMLNEYLCVHHENLIVWETLLKYYERQLLEVFKTKGLRTTAANEVKSSLEQHLLPSINGALEGIESKPIEKGEKVILHAELTFWTCFIDASQPRCKSHVEDKMNDWIIATKNDQSLSASSPFPVDLEETYFCMAASLNEAYWEQIFKYMESVHLSAAKARIANSLMCTTDMKLLHRILPYVEEDLKSYTNAIDTLKLPIKPEYVPYFRTTLRLLFNEPARKLVYNY